MCESAFHKRSKAVEILSLLFFQRRSRDQHDVTGGAKRDGGETEAASSADVADFTSDWNTTVQRHGHRQSFSTVSPL